MHKAVTTRQDVHERAEPGDVHDLAGVYGAQFHLGRVHDGADALLGGGHGGPIGGGDGDLGPALVLVDHDSGAGLFLDGIDDLALGADHFADLVSGYLEGDDLGRRLAHVVTRGLDGRPHHFQHAHPRLAGLLQCAGQHRGGDAVDLGVELESRDEVRGARDLEVHVAEGVLGPKDVGEGDVPVAVVYESHGDARHGCLDRHAGVHERHARATHRRHRGGAVGGEHLRHQPDRVRELVEARHDRQQRLLGEGAVADLAPARPAHEAGLARAERREVVVVEVALALRGVDAVHDLVHALRPQRGHVENLRLASLEQP